ncbi:hypothetical protein [Actinomadura rupiterrae]|uniref:hypothetical protein n=1 Tax=Actinomadura rupiterrae TaxID=559627 RepID=UPI0020A5CFB5|nr:hypothetical protein [Actinomadura rupiterrae]MCP2340740.1 hypothetical protein [Actinomadura rupiterrae]
MADIQELMIATDLRASLSEAEVAELRWQVGLGPRPEHIGEETLVVNEILDIVRDEGEEPVQDEDGDWVIKRFPEPAWHDGSPRAAYKIPGVVSSSLVREGAADGGRWALTCRWEIHPDGHAEIAELFDWLAGRCDSETAFFGYLRWYEEGEPDTPLHLRAGKIVTFRDGKFVPPFAWDEDDEPEDY